jgi:hypothetical protein
MMPTEFWFWLIRDERTGKFHKTRHRMDEATALARHPEAVRVENSCEAREVPETPEEAADAVFRLMTPSGSSRRPG